MAEINTELFPTAKKVEQFWRARFNSFSIEDEQRICESYNNHVLGAESYEEMGLMHAGIKSGKEDYASFYRNISDILKPSSEELEILVLEGFDWAGLMCLLAEKRGYFASPAAQVVANMVGNK